MSKGPTVEASTVNLPTTATTTILTMIPPGSRLAQVPGTGNDLLSSPNTEISGILNYTAGTGATALNISCLDNNGITIGPVCNVTVVAATNYQLPFSFHDPSGTTQKTAYMLRVAQVAATGNGTVNYVNGSVKTDG